MASTNELKKTRYKNENRNNFLFILAAVLRKNIIEQYLLYDYTGL